MGESYKGLTIRIGADATSLQKALKSVNAAAASTQKELRRLKSALKLDPDGAATVSLRLSSLGESAQSSVTKLRQLQKANEGLSPDYVSRLTEGMRNVHAYTERARSGFNAVNAALEQVNREMGKLEEKRQGTGLDASEAARLSELAEKWKALSAAHKRYQAQLENGMEAERIRDLRVEIQSAEAATRNAVKQMSLMARETGEAGSAVEGVRKVRSELAETTATAEALRKEIETLDSLSKLDPKSDAAERKMRTLSEATELAGEHAKRLETTIGQFKAKGIDDAGRSMSQLRAETKQASAAYEDAQRRVAEAAAEVDELKARQQRLAASGEAATDEYRKLGEQVKRASERMSALEAEARAATRALDTAAAREQLRSLRSEADETKESLKRLDAQDVTPKVGGLGSTMRSVGSAMTAAGVVVQTYGAKAIDSAESIDSAFRDMKKTVNGTDEDFDKLRTAAIEFSKTHVTSADTILEIEAMGGQLGISVDNLQEFADVASNLDIATDMDAETIAQTLGQLNNILEWGDGDMQRYADSLTRLGNNMPAQESAITDITKRISAAAHMYGMTTPQILAWSTAVAATGQNSEAAGTAVSNSLSNIENAVASGGDALQGFADVAGMSAEDFAAEWNSDASGAFRAFIEGLARIEDEGGSADVTLTNLGITGVRQKQALKGLSQTVGTLDSALAMSADAWDGVSDEWGAAGDAAREASQKSEGFSGAIGMLRNAAAALGAEIGEALLPIIQQLTEILSGASSWFSGLDDGTKQALVLTAALVPISGLLLDIGGAAVQAFGQLKGTKLAQGLGQVKTALTGGAGAATKFGGAMKGVGTIVSGLKGPLITLAVSGVAYLAEKIYEAWEKSRKFKEALGGISGACDLGGSSARSYEKILGDYAVSAEDAAEKSDDLVERVSNLYSTMSDRKSELEKSNGLLEDYSTTIDELAGRSDLTSEQVGLLNWAVQGLNDQCGTTYTVAQDMQGAYQIMSDGATVAKNAIHDLVEQMELQAKLSVLQNDYTDVTSELDSAQSEYADAAAAYQKKKDEVDQRTKNGDYMKASFGPKTQYDQDIEELKKYEDAMDQSKASLDACTESQKLLQEQMGVTQASLDNLGDAVARFVSTNANLLQPALDANGFSLDAFREKLSESGVSMDALGQMAQETPDKLVQLAGAFDGTSQSIITSLLQMDDGFAAAVESGQVSMDELAACFDENGSVIPEKMAEFAQSLQGSGLEAASNYVSTFAQQLSDGADQVGAATEDVADESQQVLEDGVDEAGDIAEDTTDAYSDEISDGSGDASDAAGDVSDAAERSLADVDTYSIGNDFSQGYANGILAGRDAAVNAAAQVTAAAVEAARSTQDSHSPSKVTRRLGGYFSQGYALGISDLSDESVRAARRMASDSLASVRGAYAGYDFSGAASAAAYGYNRARATYAGSRAGLTKADAYDAFDAAIKSNSGTEVAVYVDGKKLASTIAADMDSELGTLSTRRSR